MASPGPASYWDTPPPEAPRVSLLTSVPVIEDHEDERWANGFAWAPVGCSDAGLYDLCAGGEKEIPTGNEPVSGAAFGVYAADECATFGRRDHAEFARRKLIGTQSRAIERQLWDDPLGLGGASITKASSVVDLTPGAAVTPAAGLKLLEDEIGDCTNGQGAVIHARPYAVGGMLEKNLVRHDDEDGHRLLTYMGSVVVPGRGYTGSSPAGSPATTTEEWIYATGPVYVLLGEVFIVGEGAEGMDRRTNTQTVYAERAAAVAFDTACCVLAVRVTRE
jgi:hypothetical protein